MLKYAIASLIMALTIALSGGLLFAAAPADTNPGINLIPWPKQIEVKPGSLKIDEQTRVVAMDASLKPLAEILAGEYSLLTGKKIVAADGPAQAGDIVLKINNTLKADEPLLAARGTEIIHTTDGAHTISISDQAVVEGFDYRAVAEGTSTLLQALEQKDGQFSLPHLVIKDYPNADYCALMVDVARQNHPIETLKKIVEICRVYKARYLHLHMTDDQGWTFPSTKYPQLGTKNQVVGHAGPNGVAPKRYTVAELKDLVAFADARGIAIVPEIEVPGHSGAALRSFPEVFDAINPETGKPMGLGCMNMSNEKLYTVLDDIIGEAADIFKSSPYIHIGSDEVSAGRVTLNPGYKQFMAKHNLKNDDELFNYFIRSVGEMVNKHGKKAIKWEGLADGASKDIIVMTWVSNSPVATSLIANGYTTITCPWNLNVPWEQWNMYVANGARLKKGDSVLGATLVAWEQSAEFQLNSSRNLASRQERTWGPDNVVTVDGFAVRFQSTDAVVGRLIELTPTLRIPAAFEDPAGYAGFQNTTFAADGSDATFYLAGRPLKAGEALTMTFDKDQMIHAVEVLTGQNGHGLFTGDLQVSAGGPFTTVATFDKGQTKAVLKESNVKAIRLLAQSDQTEPLVLREIKFQLLTQLSSQVDNPEKAIGAGNIGALTADTTFGPQFSCDLPVLNNGHTLTFNSGGGNNLAYGGTFMGTGKIQFIMGSQTSNRDATTTLSGALPNTFKGQYVILQGRVRLQKDDGIDAMAGDILVGGHGDNDCLYWGNNNQVNDDATITLQDSPSGGATLNLNGFTDTIARLSLAPQCKVLTHGERAGGVLTVKELVVDDKPVATGVYAAGTPWVQGSGYVVVGDVKNVEIAGSVDQPAQTIGAGNIAVLKAPTTLNLSDGGLENPIKLNGSPLALQLNGDKSVTIGSFITGTGALQIASAQDKSNALELSGNSANTYVGPTTIVSSNVTLNKAGDSIAIPGDLTLDSTKGPASLVWKADGQIQPTANVTVTGDKASLDLGGHKVVLNILSLTSATKVAMGDNGQLKVHQLIRDGKPLAAGTYTSSEPWITGGGSITVDPRVDIKGYAAVGHGNIANLIGDGALGYPGSSFDIDVITNGHTLKFDSGNGNPLNYSGVISGDGNVEFYMGPSYTGFKDAPLQISGPRSNTATGKYFVKKGRVQLEKTDGADAISSDVIVGGQGFNDCLYWINSNQIKDSAAVTLLDTPNSGAAYLNLNGCTETVGPLTMTANNKVLTDGAQGKGGALTVQSLTIAGEQKPAGTYSAQTDKWIEGTGKVVVLK